jgi:NIMA (never in mitosis gene a)-related kinase
MTLQYKIIKQLGKGSYGRAFLAKNLETSELMVIKEISFDENEDHVKAAALNEIKIIEKLRHDNIIRIHNSSIQEGRILLLMEYADGGDLSKYIKKQIQIINEKKVLDIFVQLCLAVKYLHDRKILHRDLKPSNVFLTKDGIVKLGDFGVAKILGSTMALATTQVGTPFNISPEIIKGKPYGYSSDIWSLGTILFELVTLYHPFEADTSQDLSMKILYDKIPRIASIYSEEICSLVEHMLKKNPNKRPSIYEILEIPLIYWKAVSLLGMEMAEKELSHRIFHGICGGETPKNHQKEIKISVTKESSFSFMGRALNLEGKTEAKDQVDVVEKFIVKIAGEKKLKQMKNNSEDIMVKDSDKFIVELFHQLIKFKKDHNIQ